MLTLNFNHCRNVHWVMDHCYANDAVSLAEGDENDEVPTKLCVHLNRRKPSKYDEEGVGYITEWIAQLLTSRFRHYCRCPNGKRDSVYKSCGACREIHSTIKAEGAGIFIPVTCLYHHKAHFKYTYDDSETDSFDILDLKIDTDSPHSRILCYYNTGGIQYQLFPFSGESPG